MTIQVYFNAGENASRPWMVALHNGISTIQTFGNFSAPIDAIKFAFDHTPQTLPVFWPNWLRVVFA